MPGELYLSLQNRGAIPVGVEGFFFKRSQLKDSKLFLQHAPKAYFSVQLFI